MVIHALDAEWNVELADSDLFAAEQSVTDPDTPEEFIPDQNQDAHDDTAVQLTVDVSTGAGNAADELNVSVLWDDGRLVPMATYLTITATHDGSVTNRELREALRGIDADDISQSRPVDSPATLSTARNDSEQEGEEQTYRWLIRSGDRDEEFTKETTDAIVAAVSTLDDVTEIEVEGGYEPEDADETGSD